MLVCARVPEPSVPSRGAAVRARPLQRRAVKGASRSHPSVCRDAAVALPGGEGQWPGQVQRQRLGVQHPPRAQGAGAGPGRAEHGQLGARGAGVRQRRLGRGPRLGPAARQARGRLQAVPLGRRRAVRLEPHRLHLLQREGDRVRAGTAAALPALPWRPGSRGAAVPARDGVPGEEPAEQHPAVQPCVIEQRPGVSPERCPWEGRVVTRARCRTVSPL